ncbi:hypothetical protein [Paraburkholderia sp. J7]|uniref:hypothetical protein n=1 Tax=Paraburkholderia sp. J7 TaxID=2805438 RepID=UPI002AB7BD52|nr:hypothetical protein [Paraburkholderia sp. J7]
MNLFDSGVLPQIHQLLAFMQPGKPYGATALAELTGLKMTHLQVVLKQAVARRQLQSSGVSKRLIYVRPDAPAPVMTVCPSAPRGELQGYERQWGQFRALCETARRQEKITGCDFHENEQEDSSHVAEGRGCHRGLCATAWAQACRTHPASQPAGGA